VREVGTITQEHPMKWGSSRFLIVLGICLFFLGLAVWIIIAVVRFFLGVNETMDKLGP
jgi:hypothetical protein